MTQTTPGTKIFADLLKVTIFDTREEMGAEAATDVAKKIKELLLQQPIVNIIFAAAPSQNEFLSSLCQNKGINWSRVNGFHMDEYVGLEPAASQNFGNFLRKRLFEKVSFNTVHYINGNTPDATLECERYAALLIENKPDIVCMGIGENTHIAFNDPHTADFNDPLLVKVVELDEASRQQQVHDQCFKVLNDVPRTAITLTVPALLQGSFLFCIVPGINKADAVNYTINEKVQERYPSTALKQHHNATLYLDNDSASKL